MPRLLDRNTEVEAVFQDAVRALIRNEMTKRQLSYKDVAKRLTQRGLVENERNLRNRVARGELSAKLMLASLYVMGVETIDVMRLVAASYPTRDTIGMALKRARKDGTLTLLRRDDAAGTFQFRIGALETPITIKLQPLEESGLTEFRMDRILIAPEAGVRLGFSMPYGATPSSALGLALELLKQAYQYATGKGHEPREEWLEPYPLDQRVPY